MENIAIIINFCSNESEFIKPLLKECSIFASQIVVSYGDKLYNGEPDDISTIISECQSIYPSVEFVEYKVDINLPQKDKKGVVTRPTAYWHNLARWTAIKKLRNDIEWVFVCDADEVPDGNKVYKWLNSKTLSDKECYKIGTYWYFKLPIYRATTLEDSILLMNKKYLTEDNIFGDLERDYLITASGCDLVRMNLGLDGKPMWHHYSFVRSKEQFKKKMMTWGHKDDMFKGVDTDKFVEYIFRNSAINDIVHNYQYEIVENRLDE